MEVLKSARSWLQTLFRGASICVARLLLALFAILCLIGLYVIAVTQTIMTVTTSWWQAVKAYDSMVKKI